MPYYPAILETYSNKYACRISPLKYIGYIVKLAFGAGFLWSMICCALLVDGAMATSTK